MPEIAIIKSVTENPQQRGLIEVLYFTEGNYVGHDHTQGVIATHVSTASGLQGPIVEVERIVKFQEVLYRNLH
jgi:hypothetical protein